MASPQFSPVQFKALEDFEKARKQWRRGAFGTSERHRQQVKLARAYEQIVAAGVESALIESEINDAKTAQSYMETYG